MNYIAMIVAVIAVSLSFSANRAANEAIANLTSQVETLQIVANSSIRSAELISSDLVKAAIKQHIKEYHENIPTSNIHTHAP